MMTGERKSMKKILIFNLLLVPWTCFGAYTANHTSTVSWVKIYNNNVIYFGLASMPSDHQCSDNFFVLAPSLTEEQRNRYFSMLIAAKASKATVSVGYDKDAPDCVANRPVVHALAFH